MEVKCKDKVKTEWEDRKADFEAFFSAKEWGETDELGSINDYGLSVDLVEAGTFEGQREDYIRYQFSWGGPSDELRIFKNGDMEYWFLDWFDGACVDVTADEVAQEVRAYITEFINFN